jgi:phosphomannomutase
MIPSLVAFDLDGTLAASKQAIKPDMAKALTELLTKADVAVTSGGMLSQLVKQVVDELPPQANLKKLYLLPTSGASLFEYEDGDWYLVYEERLSEEEAEHIEDALKEGAEKSGVIDFNTKSYGERIEHRGSQVSLSALGQEAPLAEKEAWDPTHEKRKALHDVIAPLLPDYDVKIGGKTTIDVTKKGVNKAFGIRELSKHLSIPIKDMLYMGDELAEGGNDSTVIRTGIKTQPVKDPSETLLQIQDILDT